MTKRKAKKSRQKGGLAAGRDGEAFLNDVQEIAQRCPRVLPAMRAFQRATADHGADSPQTQQAFEELRELVAAEKRRADADAAIVPLTSLRDPREHEPGRRELHRDLMAGGLYSQMTHKIVRRTWGKDCGITVETHATAVQHGRDVIQAMKPRDPLEEMLVAQALWTHARIAHLNDLAVKQEERDNLRTVNEAADRATNTYRRLMLALAEYRRPPRTGDIFAAIKQANIAGQQVIQNQNGETENATNEQGCDAPAPAHLPADAGGSTVALPTRPADEAVDAINGAADPRGQVPLTDERLEAR